MKLTAAYCLQPHKVLSLFLPLTKGLMIKVFSQEVINVVLNTPMRKFSCSSSTD